MVSYYDPGLAPELCDEGLGSGENVDRRAHESDKVLADHAARPSAHKYSNAACSTGWGRGRFERHASGEEREHPGPL